MPSVTIRRQYSGVSTSSFLKHITSQILTPEGLDALGPTVVKLAEIEADRPIEEIAPLIGLVRAGHPASPEGADPVPAAVLGQTSDRPPDPSGLPPGAVERIMARAYAVEHLGPRRYVWRLADPETGEPLGEDYRGKGQNPTEARTRGERAVRRAIAAGRLGIIEPPAPTGAKGKGKGGAKRAAPHGAA